MTRLTRLLATALLGWATPQTMAQSTPAPEFVQFDSLDLAALAVGLEIDQWRTAVNPPPSDALQRIVAMRPAILMTPDSGQRWLLRRTTVRPRLETCADRQNGRVLLAADVPSTLGRDPR